MATSNNRSTSRIPTEPFAIQLACQQHETFCVDASVNTKHHGEFWSKMKPLLPSKNKKQSKIVLLQNDHVITDPMTVAEKFNEHFCEVAGSDGDRLKVDDFKDHPNVQIIAEKK